MNQAADDAALTAERKRSVRRSVLWLSLLAAMFYVGFIVLTVSRA